MPDQGETPAGSRWPYTEPHVGFTRYGVQLADGSVVEGVAPEDGEALDEMASWIDGRSVYQTVVRVIGGPDDGYEVKSRWKLRNDQQPPRRG